MLLVLACDQMLCWRSMSQTQEIMALMFVSAMAIDITPQ